MDDKGCKKHLYEHTFGRTFKPFLNEKDCTRAVRSAKRKFEKNIAQNGNKKPFTSYIKSKTKSRTNVGPLKVGSEIISNDKKMATILNRSFSNVFSQELRTQIMLTSVQLFLPIVP